MRLLCAIILGGLAVGTAAPVPEDPTRGSVNGIMAIVNDAVITSREVFGIAYEATAPLRQPPFPSKALYEQKWQEAVAESLDNFVVRQLILDDFKNLGGKLPENIIEDEITERIRKQYGDRATLTKTLQAEGVTTESFRQKWHDRIVMEIMRHRNVSQAIIISPAKIEGYYRTNLNQFQLDDQVKLRMIVLKCPTPSAAAEVQRRATEISMKIEEGVPFAEMASIYSDGSQRIEGGDWGWQERKFLRKGLSDVAFGLEKGQRSGILGLAPDGDAYWVCQYDKAGKLKEARKYAAKDAAKDALVETKTFGPAETEPPAAPVEFYLMLVEDKRPAHVRLLEEVRDEIEKNLEAQEKKRLEKKWLDRLRAKSYVRYFQ